MTITSNPTIVVGIDGSPASLIALRWALSEAVATKAEVDVVHCSQPQNLRDVAFGSNHELHNGSMIMLDNEVAAALRDLPNPPTVSKTSVSGRPTTVLAERARGARLLVLGAHGHTVLRDVVFGQVEAFSRKHADCPVVVVGLDGQSTRYEPAHSSIG